MFASRQSKRRSVKSLGPSSKVRAIIPFGSGETVGSEVTEASGTGETSDAAEEASEGSSTSEEAFLESSFRSEEISASAAGVEAPVAEAVRLSAFEESDVVFM